MLSDAKIRAIKPTNKVTRYSDGNGLYLEVRPTGAKSWVLRYFFNGRERRMGLGPYPEVSLKEAREAREKARWLIRNGIDPLEERKRKRLEASGALTFETIAREWHAKHMHAWAESHAKRIIARLEKHVFPFIGRKNIGEIGAPEVLSVVRRIEEQGTIETAHRVLSIINQVFRYAIVTARADRNPAADIRGAIPPSKKNHFPAVMEPERLGEVLRMLDAYQGSPVVCAALRLVPMLAVRPGELRHMKWEEIDWKAKEWRFTLSKTQKPHIVPLARQVRSILGELRQLIWDSPWCFPSDRSKQRPISDMALTAALRRLGIPREEQSIHGFRAVFRTLADEVLGFRPDIIEHQLGHTVKDPLGRAYNRTKHLEERRRLMQAWADYLDSLKAGAASQYVSN